LTNIIKLLKRKAVGGVGLATYKKERKMNTKSCSGNMKEREKKIEKHLVGKRLHLAEYAVNGVHIW
jgi:hypothetical protein